MAGVDYPTILYADDDQEYRASYGLIFRQAGFAVQEASTGSEALRLATQNPDLVVLDVNLPDINGFEVCRRIKGHPATTVIPVLHLSDVFAQTEDRTHSLEDGADAYLTKPVAPEELLAQVNALLRVRRAEDALREAARQWQATFDASSDAVCLLDLAGKIQRSNKAMAELIGLPVAAILGRPYQRLIPAALATADLPDLTRVHQTGQRETVEVAGANRSFHITADPVRDELGRVTGSVHIFADITEFKRALEERQQLEQQLIQAQKLEALGRLAGGVAHDFNNLMTVVIGNVSMLLTNLAKDHPQRDALLAIDQASWRAAELTRRLLSFSRQSKLWLRPIDLRLSIGEIVALLRRAIDPRITIEVANDPDLWMVQADLAQMNQVLMNLCLNARDAMPEGGRLCVQTANVTLDEEQAQHNLEARPGEFVRLRVADTGHGIAPDVLPRIFEPFFTTKESGKGTGLGLAMVFGIVKQHQGWITCASEVNHGTSFDIYLPRSNQQPAIGQQPSAIPRPTAAGGSETILLVDDELLIRELGQKILEEHGYRVLLAADGLEAVELFRQHKDVIDLVILDMTMPRLSGRDALGQMRQIDAAVRVLYASGYSGKAAEAGADLVLGFIGKPFRAADLAFSVRVALDKKPINS